MYRSRGWVWTAEGFIMFSYSPLIATNNLVLCLARVGRRSPLRQTFAVRASRRTINLNPCLGSLSPEGWPSRGRKGGGPPRAKWGPSSVARIRDTKPVSGRRKLESRSTRRAALQEERRATWMVTMRQILRTHRHTPYPTIPHRSASTPDQQSAHHPAPPPPPPPTITTPYTGTLTGNPVTLFVCFCPPVCLRPSVCLIVCFADCLRSCRCLYLFAWCISFGIFLLIFHLYRCVCVSVSVRVSVYVYLYFCMSVSACVSMKPEIKQKSHL